jgi:hypothetical protein
LRFHVKVPYSAGNLTMSTSSFSESSESVSEPRSQHFDEPVDTNETVHAIDGITAVDELTPLLAVLTNTVQASFQ